MSKKEGQAALEFIMTYGWAIMVVLVAIGALIYFGVLSPGKLLPNKCLLQSGITCTDAKVSISDITVKITNSLGKDLQAINFTVAGCDSVATQGIASGPLQLLNGESGLFTITCDVPLSGAKFSSDTFFNYTLTEQDISHSVSGSLIQKIE